MTNLEDLRIALTNNDVKSAADHSRWQSAVDRPPAFSMLNNVRALIADVFLAIDRKEDRFGYGNSCAFIGN